MNQPDTISGRQLYRLLPEVYRSRDEGDLAAYLGGLGQLLDRVRLTLDQRLADSFPDEPLSGPACQPWLLPYFAELLGAELVSPDARGQRAEVSKSVAWRQSKGTLTTVEQVAQAVGGLEVEVQEGWQRVAVTPRLGVPPTTARFGARGPFLPGRPAGTVRFGTHSRALRTSQDDPAGRTTVFAGDEVQWRQGYPSGAPCFPGSYEDVSARTPDLRTPGSRRGHIHPRRVLLYYPPPAGLFPYKAVPLPWSRWTAALGELDNRIAELEASGEETFLYTDLGGQTVLLSKLEDPVRYRVTRQGTLLRERFTEEDGTVVSRILLERRWIEGRAEPAGRQVVRREGDEPLVISEDLTLDGVGTFVFEGLSFLGKITLPAGRVVLRNGAARRIDAARPDIGRPVVDAADALFEDISALAGLVRLEYVTVLGKLQAGRLQASDSLFAGGSGALTPDPVPPSCVRYSRVPTGLTAFSPAAPYHNTTEPPLFLELDFKEGEDWVRRPARYGEPGAGVLDPEAPAAIRFGAEDGGEMGAHHLRRYSLAVEAVRHKLQDFLPVGFEAVLIPDPRLLAKPPGF